MCRFDPDDFDYSHLGVVHSQERRALYVPATLGP